jgi:hypothetical protein
MPDDLTKPIALDTEVHLLALDLNPEIELCPVTLEAIANDCIFGIMRCGIWSRRSRGRWCSGSCGDCD